MAYVDTVVGGMTAHCAVTAVADSGLSFLNNLAMEAGGKAPLMVHVPAALAVMAKYAEHDVVSMRGVFLLYNLSELPANVAALKAAGAGPVVLAAVTRHGGPTGVGANVKGFGELLLPRLQ